MLDLTQMEILRQFELFRSQRGIGQMATAIDITMFEDPRKVVPSAKPWKPSKDHKPYKAVRTRKTPTNKVHAMRAEFVNSIFGNWSMFMYLHVLTLTLYV